MCAAAALAWESVGIRFSMQLERGRDQQRLHVHVLLRCVRSSRWPAIAALLAAAFPHSTSGIRAWSHEAARVAAAAAAYCIKEDGRVAGPWVSAIPPVGGDARRTTGDRAGGNRSISVAELGDVVIAGCRAGVPTRDMIEANPSLAFRISAIDSVRRLYRQPHDATRPFQTIWIYGPTGTGKTTSVSALFHGTIFRATSTPTYLQSYVNERIIVFDDMTQSRHMQSTEDFIRICDPTTTDHKILYGVCRLVHEVVVFTSNFTPDEVFERTRLAPMHRRIDRIIHVPFRDVYIEQVWDLDLFMYFNKLGPMPFTHPNTV